MFYAIGHLCDVFGSKALQQRSAFYENRPATNSFATFAKKS